MKRLVSAFFLLFLALDALGQYGQEWIQFGQPYFKMPVAAEGLYRLTYADLQKAGVALSTDPRTFQVFHRGVEQAIRVEGEADGSFDTSDYIEFFGRANDGAPDSTLYESTSYQPHRYYNLFTDTTAYFLTYGGATGKRMSVYSQPPGALSAESYHWAEKLLILKDTYSGGVDYGDVQRSVFDEGEGWMGNMIRQGEEATYNLSGITDGLPAAAKPRLEVLLTGRGAMNHQAEIYAGGRLLASVSFQGYQSFKQVQEIEWSDIDGNGVIALKVRVTGAGGIDRLSAGYIRLRFPQRITMTGVAEKFLTLSPNPLNESLINVQEPAAGTRLFDVTNADAPVQVLADFSTTLNAVIPSTASERRIFATAQIRSPAWVKRVSFRDIDPAEHNYIIITNRLLRKPAKGYIDPVKAYAEYRSLPEGGGFDTLVVNIDQLYDQFNYGEPSPRAIFQFVKFLASVKLPQYLFIIGKGLDVNYGYWRNPAAFTEFRDLVPTAGYPASDLTFSVGLSGIADVPAIATGRLSANRPEEVASYLNKVKERDAMPFNELRRKRILHLSGGIEESEPAAFRSILAELQPVAEGVYLGADVHPLSKGGTEVKVVNLADEVNAGLGLITFFGHSAPSTLDFDIGLVTDPVMGYNNKGKYPFLFMNGCNAGSIFLNGNIFGENWIKTADKGAIGFIAHTAFGLVSSLKHYSSLFYDVAFADSTYIKKGVGDVQREVARRFVAAYGTGAESVSQTRQMILLGDPAVRLFGAEKPDFAIAAGDVYLSSTDGEAITAHSDSFEMRIPVKNYGLAVDRNLRVEVTRQSADGAPVVYDTIVSPVLYADTLTMLIRNPRHDGYGINVFSITVDADNLVDEISESNNTVSYEYFIPSNSTRNLYPYNYGIVQARKVRLSFQNTDLQGQDRKFAVELDTVNTFDSGFRQQYTVTGGVLASQDVQLLAADTLVYYWRTRLAEPDQNESAAWAVHSFTYIANGAEGWSQAHFPQFEANKYFGLVHDPVMRRLRYQETVSDIAIKTFSAASAKPVDSVSVKINGAEFNLLYEGGACRDNTINLIAFDRKSTEPYAGIYFKWYELLYDYGGRRLLCGREPYVINSFTSAELVTGNNDDLIQYIDNIHAGDSVVLFNIGDAGYSEWPPGATAKLAEIGVSMAQVSSLEDGEPLVIFGRKGSAPGTAKIFLAPSPGQPLEVSKTIAGRYTAGTMSSVLIGPAQRWDKLIFQTRETEAVDDVSFSIVGINPEGQQDTLKREVASGQDLSFIDAEAYPFLKLIYENSDDINLTPVQLRKWLVLYQTVPEGLVFYRGPSDPQVVSEGEPFSGGFGFVNVADKAFSDSLTVRYDLLNHLQGGQSSLTKKMAAPLPGDTTLFTLDFNTASKVGLNDVEVFVNPRIEKEQSYDNNMLVLPGHLDVLSDPYHPVLEVTVDGRVIRNLEFVQPSPEITVRLWDENSFLLKADTSGINIFLASPCAAERCDFERISFLDPNVRWQPASADSAFTATVSLHDLPDGTYTLRVEARDARGNRSGEEPYEVSFRVLHERTVVTPLPYPNPFYLQTCFDVIVTGETETVSRYRLDIYTAKGVLVREFPDDGVPDLHVGTNRVIWDGLDSGGASLPNGIYLYRLAITRGDDELKAEGRIMLLR